ncbi:glycosyltransferase family 8 protein [Metabacillus sediminilitoris]|uniref:Glycosyltransferase family 8 protein n=1 Tax=Metabacillus sediminilitoris TaxID=2567941 RepID=A0A4S4C0T5_9BACI|nr:glycosyltransferase family 8 protein [Metabacillus sediminilitoris]QGQ47220.1 glycosyltransferase family 8 protein [Metabacillus sediminilitoris]THF80564.1 glycosyltransferase family 8 protein [Metabacillus sediminilitoris]
MNLNVVYSSDNNYAQHVGVSMTSLFENNDDFNNIDVYLIENNISLENKNNLKLICKNYKRTIKFINFKEFSNKPKLNIGNSISISSYARLFLSSMLDDDINKVIYLDCDSIINSSLKDLWDLDLSKYFVAGVCDTVSDETKLKINMELYSPYLNAGMLLINLQKWREERVEEKFIKFIDSYKGQVFHHDQGTINGVLNNKFLILHPKYNSMSTYFSMSRKEIMQYYGLKDYYSEEELKEAINYPVFIHYTPAFVNRPWIKGCKHPLASLYKKYLGLTPWEETELIQDKRSIGEKTVAFLYNHLPFKMANGICNLIFK